MDITDKQITVESLSITSFPAKSIATVTVREEVITNVYKVIGTYSLTFEQAYQGAGDPALLAAIADKLTEIPV